MLIKVHIPRATAIRHQLDRSGTETVDIDFCGWSDEERNTLAEIVGEQDRPVHAERFTERAVLNEVRRVLASVRQEQERAAKRAEAALELPALARQRTVVEGHAWALTSKVGWDDEHPGAAYQQVVPSTMLYAPYDSEQSRIEGAVAALRGGSEGTYGASRQYITCSMPDDLAAELRSQAEQETEANRVQAVQAHLERQAKISAEAEARRAESAAREQEADDLFLSGATEEQKRRHAAGFLPEKERNEGARNAVFALLANEPRYQTRTHEHIPHEEECAEQHNGDRTQWYVEDTGELTAEEFAPFARIADTAREIATRTGWEVVTQPREHVGQCDECSQQLRVIGILVTVKTARGNQYSREFAA